VDLATGDFLTLRQTCGTLHVDHRQLISSLGTHQRDARRFGRISVGSRKQLVPGARAGLRVVKVGGGSGGLNSKQPLRSVRRPRQNATWLTLLRSSTDCWLATVVR
jgi:hypothetical protein